MEKNWLDWVALVLVIVGAVNWGIYAFGYDLVNVIVGSIPWLATTIYALIGLAGLYMIYFAIKE